MDLITVAVFNNAFNAHVVQGRLQADGVECYLKDVNTVQANPFYNLALGGIKLQVKETEVQMAVFVLHQLGYRTVFDALPETEKKPTHILIRFLKFLAAAIALMGLLYFQAFLK